MTTFNAVRAIAIVSAFGLLGLSSAQAATASKSAISSSGAPYCYNQQTGSFRHWGPCTNLYRTCGYDGCTLQRRFW